MDKGRNLAKAIGPGLLFAGAAIGASHLVQATRAGATFGLAMLSVVVVACLVKYPAFSFGPRYAAATGMSLLEGYRRQGRWALVLYGFVTLFSVFTVQAAVAFVTAGLAKALLDVSWDPLLMSAVIIAVCLGLLRAGSYAWLDAIVKVAVLLLTVGTLLATILVIPQISWNQPLWPSSDILGNTMAIFFIAGLVGWMPSAIDLSVWNSLWTLAKRRSTGYKPSVKESLFDFNLGYIGTALLAVCFVLLGAGVVHGTGVVLPDGAAPFAASIIGLYTTTLGGWAYYVLGFAAFLVMFSTTITVVDGFPRAISAFVARFQSAEEEGEAVGDSSGRNYWISALVIAAGSLLILSQFLGNLKQLVMMATMISLVTAPPLAWLNHHAIFSDEIQGEGRPSQTMRAISLLCIVLQGLFAAYFLYVKSQS